MSADRPEWLTAWWREQRGYSRVGWRFRLHLTRQWLGKVLAHWAHGLGYPHAHYDGVPAALELEDICAEFDAMGVPRAIEDWPLAPRQRAAWLRRSLEVGHG